METHFCDELVGLSRLFGVFQRDAICCGSVSVPQCVVLSALLEGGANVSTLARTLGVTNSAMTRLLDGLEKRHYVERLRSTGDRRRVELRLTPEGRVEAERLRELTQDAVRSLLAQIPAQKHAQVLESLALVREALDKTRGSFPGCG
jgi:DNA-binding MarR family transcriptional regulator